MRAIFNRALLLVLFVSVSTTGANLTPVPMAPGGNRVDIDNNGKPDLAILVQFDDNHTHNCHGISFFIYHPDGGFSMVSVANSDKFVWLDSRLNASSTKVLVNRLFHDGRRYYLVQAQKYGANLYILNKLQDARQGHGERLTSRAFCWIGRCILEYVEYTVLPVKFTLYLLDNHQGEPGEPHYRWHAWRSFLGQQRYGPVEESFAEIVRLNPDTPEKRYVAP